MLTIDTHLHLSAPFSGDDRARPSIFLPARIDGHPLALSLSLSLVGQETDGTGKTQLFPSPGPPPTVG